MHPSGWWQCDYTPSLILIITLPLPSIRLLLKTNSCKVTYKTLSRQFMYCLHHIIYLLIKHALNDTNK